MIYYLTYNGKTPVVNERIPIYEAECSVGVVCVSGSKQISDYSTDLNQFCVTLCQASDEETITVDPTALVGGNWMGVSWATFPAPGPDRTQMYRVYLPDVVGYSSLRINITGPVSDYYANISADNITRIYASNVSNTYNISAYKGDFIWVLVGDSISTSSYDIQFLLI